MAKLGSGSSFHRSSRVEPDQYPFYVATFFIESMHEPTGMMDTKAAKSKMTEPSILMAAEKGDDG